MRRVRILVLAVILIAIVCAGISLYAYQHNKRAEENTIDIIKDFKIGRASCRERV